LRWLRIIKSILIIILSYLIPTIIVWFIKRGFKEIDKGEAMHMIDRAGKDNED